MSTSQDISVHIRGAGLMGRVLALDLQRRGHRVVLTDPDPKGRSACAWTGAGMLAPSSELDGGEAQIHALGREGMRRWSDLVADLDVPLSFDGTLVVAHANDRAEFDRFHRRLLAGGAKDLERLGPARITELEPALSFTEALYLSGEGQVDNRAFLAATQSVLDIRPLDTEVDADWEIDCRGLGARDRFPDLRGVRGELLYVHAPEVSLKRPVRLLHPRYPLYIVPRRDETYVIGASQIESEDRGPISVRTALELLSAAYAVHSGFAEARIIDMSTNLRPAFPDHLPRIVAGERQLAINGLFRHGFLLAPTLSALACRLIEGEMIDSPIVQQGACAS